MKRPPNIVLIIIDQQRADTIGACGQPHMRTPHLDALCESSVTFRLAFAQAATCVASRACLFTGMYPHNTGVYSFDAWAGHRNWVEDLSDAGYHCANIGKMHLVPLRARGGFHERVVVENPTTNFKQKGEPDDAWGEHLRRHGMERPLDRHLSDPDWDRRLQAMPWTGPEEMHSDVYVGAEADSWLRHYDGSEPFFLEVGFPGPHEPWDPLPRHLAAYDGVELPVASVDAGDLAGKPPQHAAHRELHAGVSHESRIDLRGASQEELDRMRRHYFAKITTVDEQIGRVLTALRERRWDEDKCTGLGRTPTAPGRGVRQLAGQ